MAVLPVVGSATANAIYAEYQRQRGGTWRRPHLGASLIGHHCERSLWYTFRWCSTPSFSGRMYRLFESGSLEEPRVVNNLRAIGCTVHDLDPSTGYQFRYQDFGGHFAGSLDGAVLGVPEAAKTWHLLEIKTHNDKSFAKLQAGGVQAAKPQHLAQMVCYMGWSGLTRALYFAVNKNDDAIYTERVPENPSMFQMLRERAQRVITTAVAPSRQSLDCEWCDHRDLCFGERLPLISCRTCRSAVPVLDGNKALWRCTRTGEERNALLQERGCDDHLFLPSLVGLGAAVEEHDDYVIYQKGTTFFANTIPAAFPAFNGESYRSVDLERAR